MSMELTHFPLWQTQLISVDLQSSTPLLYGTCGVYSCYTPVLSSSPLINTIPQERHDFPIVLKSFTSSSKNLHFSFCHFRAQNNAKRWLRERFSSNAGPSCCSSVLSFVCSSCNQTEGAQSPVAIAQATKIYGRHSSPTCRTTQQIT